MAQFFTFTLEREAFYLVSDIAHSVQDTYEFETSNPPNIFSTFSRFNISKILINILESNNIFYTGFFSAHDV
jgi:hypothetical protein